MSSSCPVSRDLTNVSGNTDSGEPFPLYQNDKEFEHLTEDLFQKDPIRPSFETENLVRDCLRNWNCVAFSSPNEFRSITSGYSEMACFSIINNASGKRLFAKSVIGEEIETNSLLSGRSPLDRVNLSNEARRAQKAGQLGLGPKVEYIDPYNSVYFCEFVDGHALSPAEVRDESVLPLILDNMDKLRTSEIDFSLDSKLSHWIRRVNLKSCFFSSESLLPSLEQFTKMEIRINRELSQQPEISPCWVHTDLKPQNIMGRVDGTYCFVDWCHLTYGCPMSSLAYFAGSADIDPREQKQLLEMVIKNAPHHPVHLPRLQLETALFDLKSIAFLRANYPNETVQARHFCKRLSLDLSLLQLFDNNDSPRIDLSRLGMSGQESDVVEQFT